MAVREVFRELPFKSESVTRRRAWSSMTAVEAEAAPQNLGGYVGLMAKRVSELFQFIAEIRTLNLPGIGESYSNGLAISTGRKWPAAVKRQLASNGQACLLLERFCPWYTRISIAIS